MPVEEVRRMERLTIPDVRVDEHTTRRTMIDARAVKKSAMDFYWRLKAYEDTERTPEEVTALGKLFDYALEESKTLTEQLALLNRIRDLAEADRAGLLVVLPCKVGDTVYGFHGSRTILPMVAKWIETCTNGWCIAVQYAPMAPRFYQFSDFGQTVFLTREAAEKALEAMKDE